MSPTWFDDLTKALATPNSRRQALRRIGGTLTGAILATWPFGHALADNSACARFCEAVFGENTPAEEQCAADAAHGKGLCYTCGPASPGGTQPICCPQNSLGQCTSYSSATCCSGGQVCQNGTCVTPTTTTTTSTTSTTTTSSTTTITTTPPPCSGLGGSCSSSSNCCSGLVCDTTAGTCVSCIPNLHLGCSSSTCGQTGCCSGSICDGDQCLPCPAISNPCLCDADCCPGFTCVNGECF